MKNIIQMIEQSLNGVYVTYEFEVLYSVIKYQSYTLPVEGEPILLQVTAGKRPASVRVETYFITFDVIFPLSRSFSFHSPVRKHFAPFVVSHHYSSAV